MRLLLRSASLTLALLGATFATGCANDTGLVDVKFAGSTSPNTDDTSPDGGESPDDPDTGDDGDDTPDNPDGEDPTDPGDDPTDPGDPGDPSPSLSCGMVVIRDLRISGGSGNDIDFRAWADLDLMDPDASTLNDLAVSPGTYDRVRFTMHKRTGNGSGGPGTGNPVVNHSIHLCGTWQGQAWDYTDDTTENVDRRDLAGVSIDGDGPAKLFVVFDMTTWFDGIDLTGATVAADGVVYLAHDQNKQLQQALRDNIRDSIHLANHAPH